MRNRGFADGVAMGLAASAVIIFTFFWMIDGLPKTISDNLSQIFTVVATLIAALIALSGVERTIKATLSLEEERRSRKLSAARAVLPLSLSRLYSICDNRVDGIVFGTSAIEPFTVSVEDIENLKEAIELSSGLAKATLEELAYALQIAEARNSHPKPSEKINSPSLDYADKAKRFRSILDWCSLKAIVECLFRYARFSDLQPQRDGAVIRTALYVEDLSFDDGTSLLSDPDFRKQYAIAQNGTMAFANRRWLERARSSS